MGNAKRLLRLSNRILGVSMILLSIFAATAHYASAAGCSATILKDHNGSYSGCSVKMGNREYSVGKEASSENGCSQVCNIMAEVNGSRSGRNPKISAANLSR